MRRPSNLTPILTAPPQARVPVDAGQPTNYLDLYGLSKPPFGGLSDNSAYILFPLHRRPFEMLVDHMLNGSGIVLVVGEEGIGKSATLRSAAAVAADSGLKTIMVSRPPDGRITLEQLAAALEGQPETFHQAPRKALLVEDIGLLPANCASFLLALARAKPDDADGSAIVLTGSGAELSQPEIAELVGLARNTIRLLRLGAPEIRQYIERSLWIAGGTTRRLISPDAMRLVTARCGGVPGNVNRIMEAALTAGFARGDPMITAKTVDAVLGPGAPRARPRPIVREPSPASRSTFPIIATALLVIGASLFLYRGLTGLYNSGSPGPAAAVPTREEQARAAKPAARLPPELMALLMKRGSESLELGDIAAARLLFLRAAEDGNAAAATALAKTYDPNFATAASSRDPARAAEWYQKAIKLGDPGAADLLKRLMSR